MRLLCLLAVLSIGLLAVAWWTMTLAPEQGRPVRKRIVGVISDDRTTVVFTGAFHKGDVFEIRQCSFCISPEVTAMVIRVNGGQ